MFYYINHALSVILVYVGLKMIAAKWIHIHPALSLLFIALVLTMAITASIKKNKGGWRKAEGGRKK
jgi:predicted tellurium resistance membrane protein TerC